VRFHEEEVVANDDEPADALETLVQQDETIGDLYDKWDESRQKLSDEESVETRWEKGSVAKLILQHVAIRESAKEALAGRLREVGEAELADRVEGDGPGRRVAIGRVDETMRGRQAISVNDPDSDKALADLETIMRAEIGPEIDEVVPAARQALGTAGERGLPSDRHVRSHATTHPSPVPGRLDRIGPVKALRAVYQNLRGHASGGMNPDVDSSREPDPR
jgi:hypothetical protein